MTRQYLSILLHVLVFLSAACVSGAEEVLVSADGGQSRSAESPPLSSFPTMKYGTAWKKDRTSALVYDAIMAGFRHIDTACQPKHYNEKVCNNAQHVTH